MNRLHFSYMMCLPALVAAMVLSTASQAADAASDRAKVTTLEDGMLPFAALSAKLQRWLPGAATREPGAASKAQ